MDSMKCMATSFDKKHTHTVEMPQLNLAVQQLRPEIVISRTKADPGAIHMVIQTKGGTTAILRYAYAMPALTRKVNRGQSLYQIKTKYNTANLIIGSFAGPLEDEGNILLELLLAIINTNTMVPTNYDKDGFIRLVRRYRYSGNAAKFGDDPKKVSYVSEISIQCYGIRDDNDEVVVALVNAISMWGNKIDIHYNGHGPYERYTKNAVSTMLLRNHTIIDALDEMTDAGLSDGTINLFIPEFSNMFELIDDMPVYKADSNRRRNASPPLDGYFYNEDYDVF